MNILLNIDVADLPSGIDFYTRAFDLKCGRRFGAGAVELVGASMLIYLLAKAEGSQAHPSSPELRRYDRHWTPVHFDVVVDHIETAVAKAVGAGATLEKPVTNSKWGKLALMADPFGHGFCFVQFVGAGYDEIAIE